MGRKLMRVPLDFEYPTGEVWEGYSPSLENLQGIKEIVEQVPEILEYKGNICEECNRIINNCSEEARHCIWYNEILRDLWYHEPATGEGYQLWETTSEGSPQSPVFKTLEELCEWCEENATTFAHFKASKEEWINMLNDDFVHHKQGNAIFI